MDHEPAELIEAGTNEDRDQLGLLSIFHYVVAGIVGLCSCFPVIHLSVGIAMLSGAIPDKHGSPEFTRILGGILVGVASLIIVLGWCCAIAILIAGIDLGKPRHYTFRLVVAAIQCLMMPFGTILGAFTIIVLMRPSVKAMFAANDARA